MACAQVRAPGGPGGRRAGLVANFEVRRLKFLLIAILEIFP